MGISCQNFVSFKITFSLNKCEVKYGKNAVILNFKIKYIHKILDN